ncbi:outer membrane protein assembly factor BamE [Gilvimarinus xylanilyticus]|uniref:Outer membrane protein assembly factor BamE n=1 Tax=Gilvimarinus xylanilyticus TaxID=2944139 RepID=A0A9X2HSP8_9GAMM|nr:outer membrane protein assembly factor BamE [Gilvimarinus xylanilyticus]MCP8897843.1 outer membrane protein assembly factor BamE [Gilvimarinus xylanilyticus]
MKIIHAPLLILGSLFLLAGCQYFQFPGVHKINVQQGHVITEEMIGQLEPGMNKRQVRFILGTPLIDDMFNDDRWDYYYSLKTGDGRFFKRTLTVYFDGDTYTHYEGENLPEPTPEDDELPENNLEPDTPVPSNS